MTLKCEKTKIIEPINPNKSTGLFTGKSSGILNWNNLLYPEMHEIRTKIRETFYNASNFKTQLPESITGNKDIILQVNELTLKVVSLTQKNINNVSQVEGLVTDPSLVSIMATMSDQMYEHIRSMYRLGTEEFESIQLEEIKNASNPSDLLAVMEDIIKDKKEIITQLKSLATLLSEVDGVQKLVEHLVTDHENHIGFIEKIETIAKQEFTEKGLI